MIETREQVLAATRPPQTTQFLSDLKRLSTLVIVTSLMALRPAQADEPEDHYLRILNLVEQAESLSTNRQSGQALAKFQQARTALLSFQKTYPTWNVKVVSFRSKYLTDRVATLSSPPPGIDSTVQVKLLNAGTEPRKVLRLHPKPDDKQTLGLAMKVATDTKLGEIQTPAMKLPEMTLTIEATVKSVSPDGDITYETVVTDASVVEDPDVLPQVAEAVKSTLSGMKGMSGTVTKSSRGFNKGTDIKIPPGADPQMRQTIGQMKEAFSQVTLALPEEAVGLGAKWEVKMPLDSQGMKINQTATYELVAAEGDHLTARSSVTQSASKQKIQNPAMPTLKLELNGMVGTGTGEVTLDLAQLMPSQGTTDSHSELSMEMDVGGQKQAMTVKVDVHVRIEPK